MNSFSLFAYERIKQDLALLKPHQLKQITHIQLEIGKGSLRVGFGEYLNSLARKSKVNLDFLPALKHVRVVVAANRRASVDSLEGFKRRAEEQLEVLLAGKDLEIVFETDRQTEKNYTAR